MDVCMKANWSLRMFKWTYKLTDASPRVWYEIDRCPKIENPYTSLVNLTVFLVEVLLKLDERPFRS